VNGALGIAAGFVGFAFLVYAAKGSSGTQWHGQIAPGQIFKQLLLGRWPYAQVGQGQGGVPIPQTGPNAEASTASPAPGGQLA
jgi:hypothetical protein